MNQVNQHYWNENYSLTSIVSPPPPSPQEKAISGPPYEKKNLSAVTL